MGVKKIINKIEKKSGVKKISSKKLKKKVGVKIKSGGKKNVGLKKKLG